MWSGCYHFILRRQLLGRFAMHFIFIGWIWISVWLKCANRPSSGHNALRFGDGWHIFLHDLFLDQLILIWFLCFFILSHQWLDIQVIFFLISLLFKMIRIAFWMRLRILLLILKIFFVFKLILAFIFIINFVKLLLFLVSFISPILRGTLVV